MAIATTNPATGEMLKTFEPIGEKQIEEILANAAAAAAALRDHLRPAGRLDAGGGGLLLEAEQDEIARLMTMEMGKPILEAKDEVAKCASACRYYAEHAEAFLADEPADAGAVGAAAGVRPLPAARPGARRDAVELPALAGHPVRRAGADGRQRRAAQARVERAADRALARGAVPRAGFPRGRVPDAADRFRARSRRSCWTTRVRAATLTGSEPAGRSVAAIAGRELKKTVLELGGSDPFVVMPSADFDRAVAAAVTAPGARTAASRASRRSGSSCTPTSTTRSPRAFVDRDGGARRRRPARPRHGHRSAGHRAGPRRRGRAGGRRRRQGRDGADAVAARPTGRLVLPADRGHRPHPRHADVQRGGVRPGRRRSTGSRSSTRRSSWPTAPTSGWAANVWTTDPAEQERVRRRRWTRARSSSTG